MPDNRSLDEADFKIVPFEERHANAARELSLSFSWPHRREDWLNAVALGHGLVVEHMGALIGTAVWWPYEPTCATMGLIIVSSDFQGRGLGRRLLQTMMAQAEGRTMLLNATIEGRRLYDTSGFVPCGGVWQHQGILAWADAPEIKASPIRAIQDDERDAVIACDQKATGLDRKALLTALLAQGEFLVMEENDTIVGYVCRRAFGRGHVIGPVVAQTEADAQALLMSAAKKLDGLYVRTDVPENSPLSSWLQSVNMKKVDEVVSMRKGPLPQPVGDARVFAVASQSLG